MKPLQTFNVRGRVRSEMRARRAAVALLLAWPLHGALAQLLVPTVSASVSGYTALGTGVIAEADRLPITISRNDAALHAEASGSGTQSLTDRVGPGLQDVEFASATVAAFAAADPGVLHVFASDMAISQPAIIGPNLPPTTNLHNAYTNVAAGASFSDFLHVDVAGLAIGTAVQVPINFVAEVIASTALGVPQFSAHPIAVGATFMLPGFGPQIFSTETNLFLFRREDLADGREKYVVRGGALVNTRVGDDLSISASFGISGQANITDSFHPQSFGAYADGRDTVGIFLGALPAGMRITSASGHDYSVDPTSAVIAAVPEPDTFALLAAGLGGLGFVARRRSRQER